jgi:hypothetical protein
MPKTTHGMTGTAEHNIWHKMKSRCFNVKDKQFSFYGGRGIKPCERWMKFENFLADMGPRPSAQHSIDRKDNDGPYSPENCRWATPQEQNRNNRNNNLLTWRGETLSIVEWSERTGLPATALYKRFQMGWDVERMLTAPRRSQSAPRLEVK